MNGSTEELISADAVRGNEGSLITNGCVKSVTSDEQASVRISDSSEDSLDNHPS